MNKPFYLAARPMIQMSLSTPTIVAGSKDMKMTVATCVSANGKPPAVITWDTELDGEANTEEIRNADGTITVRSDYIMTPSREAHEQRLTCISTYNNDQQTDNVILNIQCKQLWTVHFTKKQKYSHKTIYLHKHTFVKVYMFNMYWFK